MKLLVFSDIHNDLRALARLLQIEADYYIAAGDLVSWEQGLDAAGAVLKQRGERVYVLPGNHESEDDIARLCATYGLNNLHGRSLRVDGVHIAGLGYSNPTPFDTPGECSEAELARRLAVFAALSPLVLVCHCPPRDTPLDCAGPGRHYGSESVRRFLLDHKPAFFFCGHIHEAEGVRATVGETPCVNVGKRGYLLDLATIAPATLKV